MGFAWWWGAGLWSLCSGGSAGPQCKRLQLSPSVETPSLPSTQASGPHAVAPSCREPPRASVL